MPVITIRLGKGRPIEKKRALAEAVTNAVAGTLDLRREWVNSADRGI
jgi:4-oxalocrotonate tautomerase